MLGQINVAVRCSSNNSWVWRVQGNSAVYIVRFSRHYHKNKTTLNDYSCTCKAYSFGGGKYCKHIKSVMNRRCGWDSRFDIEDDVSVGDDYFCPRCGGDAHKYTWSST